MKKEPYIARSENDPKAKKMSYWQPERLSLKDGWNSLKKSDKLLYILLLAGTLYFNCSSYSMMPNQINLTTWFGYSSSAVSKTAYCIFTFGIMCYIVYRDIINRSVSRRKLFIPVIFYLANYFIVSGILGKF